MGCDIHLYTERRTKNKNWVNADYWKVGMYAEDGEYEEIPIIKCRDYTLFSVLANVRNRAGNSYVSEPKGFPSETCPEVEREYKEWKSDAHSASYFTLRELMRFYKDNRLVKEQGLISPAQDLKLKDGILPCAWCVGTTMQDFVYREWETESPIRQLIEALQRRICELEYLRGSIDENIDRILELADDYRIVFWFDN